MKDRRAKNLSVPAVAAQCRVSEKTIRSWIHEGRGGIKLNAERAGATGKIKISQADLDAFLKL